MKTCHIFEVKVSVIIAFRRGIRSNTSLALHVARPEADTGLTVENKARLQPILSCRLDDIQVGRHDRLWALLCGRFAPRCVPCGRTQSVLFEGLLRT